MIVGEPCPWWNLAQLGTYLGYPIVDFPHATHAFLIERYTTHHSSGKHSAYATLGITSLPTEHAHPTPIAPCARPPLAHQEPTALGPRRHLHRRPLPRAHRQRTPRHGHLPQPRHQHPAPPRLEQHRPRTTPHGTQPHLTRQTTSRTPCPNPGGRPRSHFSGKDRQNRCSAGVWITFTRWGAGRYRVGRDASGGLPRPVGEMVRMLG